MASLPPKPYSPGTVSILWLQRRRRLFLCLNPSGELIRQLELLEKDELVSKNYKGGLVSSTENRNKKWGLGMSW